MAKVQTSIVGKCTSLDHKELIRIATVLGFQQKRHTGSHMHFFHPEYQKHITIVNPSSKPQKTTVKILREVEQLEIRAGRLHKKKEYTPMPRDLKPVAHMNEPKQAFVEPKIWGEWLKTIRMKDKLTQKEVSFFLGVPQPKLCNIEQGKAKFTESQYENWLALFKIPKAPYVVPTLADDVKIRQRPERKKPEPKAVVAPVPPVVEPKAPAVLEPTFLAPEPEPLPDGLEQINDRSAIIQRAAKILGNRGLSDGQAKFLVALLRSNAAVMLGL